jgi:DNA polymerase II small subunit/DNA polymerase delta subunit B
MPLGRTPDDHIDLDRSGIVEDATHRAHILTNIAHRVKLQSSPGEQTKLVSIEYQPPGPKKR